MRLAFSRRPLDRAALAFAAATLTLLILILGRPYFTNAAKPQIPLPSLFAIQFPSSVDDIDAILSDVPSPDREVLRIKLNIDYFLIPSYVGLLVTLALLARNPPSRPTHSTAQGSSEPRPSGSGQPDLPHKLLPPATALTAVAAGVFNLIQDRALLQLLNTPLSSTTQQMADAIRRSALAKWSLLAICAATLLLEWSRSRQNKT